jgi:hypothetical protein
MVSAASKLLDKNFELAFIAGVLGNIKNEGSIGLFEKSNYVSNPSLKPDYLKYMEKYYSYGKEYSGKNITEKNLSVVPAMLEKLEPNSWRDEKTKERRGFGLGSAQWTFKRTKDIVEIYNKVASSRDTITFEEAAEAESIMFVQELMGKEKRVYTDWQEDNQGNLDSGKAAYEAGYAVCTKYERPTNAEAKAHGRAIAAQKIYDVMKGR